MFPLGSIRALDFFAEHDSHFPIWHQEQLQNLLDFMPSLVSLRFPAVSTKSYQYSATAGLSCCTRDGELLLPLMPGDGDSPIRCPLLTTLCIETPGPWGLERLVPHIADVLAARARAGVPLQSLTLRVPQRVYTMQPLLKDLALRCEPVRREVFDAVALHVEELKLELDGEAPGPDELASRGTHWEELSEEAEKYWVTPDGMAPQWFRSWR
ncbi:hypothetical protein TRAPUB_10342 [Trametes pubescens]|uniref:Uncharacterized protein n=1 Tax=Trametes pubescens TaxID=154538 RepID=A0A1M2W009_TRAPU|nr:hypothetical protein TRAPUB_10342 [Trametes pubescens]